MPSDIPFSEKLSNFLQIKFFTPISDFFYLNVTWGLQKDLKRKSLPKIDNQDFTQKSILEKETKTNPSHQSSRESTEGQNKDIDLPPPLEQSLPDSNLDKLGIGVSSSSFAVTFRLGLDAEALDIPKAAKVSPQL